jgi:hypothetical protein
MFELLEAVCEERASSDVLAELERLVRGSDEARWVYLTYLDLHGTLLWDAAGGLGVDPALVPWAARADAGHRAASPRRSALFAVSLAASLVVALGIWFAMGDRPPVADGRPDESALPIASSRHEKARSDHGPVQLPNLVAPAPNPSAPTTPHRDVAANTTPQRGPASAAADGDTDSQRRLVAQIDEHLRSGWERLEVVPAPRADDAEWVRRVYLDLHGRIPTLAEAERFLGDARADKRARLVDALLDDGAYARNFTTLWTKLLVGRSPNARVDRDSLQKYLRMSFASNRPWNAMVADLIAAEGRTDENGAANFLVAHLNNQAVPATAITSRLFLCTQIQCAQCHNHPFNDTRQTAFWEFNSLFQQAEVVARRDARSRAVVAELVSQPEGGPIYYETLLGLMKVAFPRYNGVEVDPAPQVNRRQELARLMTEGEQPQLATAFVNRLWAHFLGAGFTRPVDDMGSHNPPSHPELLALLSEQFVQSGYDTKQLIRWICASEAYQLSSRHPSNVDELAAGDFVSFRQVYVKPMTPEQLYDSLVTATKAHLAGATDWTAAEAQRQRWLEQFVVSLQNDENDEAETLSGTHAQALMLMNGELITEALSLAPGTFLGELVRDRGTEADKIRQLCLASLSRPPTAKELPAMQKMVRRAAASGGGYQDLFWALLNSNEFALVH